MQPLPVTLHVPSLLTPTVFPKCQEQRRGSPHGNWVCRWGPGEARRSPWLQAHGWARTIKEEREHSVRPDPHLRARPRFPDGQVALSSLREVTAEVQVQVKGPPCPP